MIALGQTIKLSRSFLRAARMMRGWRVGGEFFAAVLPNGSPVSFGIEILDRTRTRRSYPEAEWYRVTVLDLTGRIVISGRVDWA